MKQPLLVILFSIVFFCSAPVIADPLKLIVPISGFKHIDTASRQMTELVAEHLSEPFEIVQYPPARMIRSLQADNACALFVVRIQSALHRYRWAAPIYSISYSYYTTWAGAPAPSKNSIVGLVGREDKFEILQSAPYSIQRTNDFRYALKMLRAGRIDYWLTIDFLADFLRKSQTDLELHKAAPAFDAKFWATCSLRLDDAVFDHFKQTIHQTKKNGSLQAVAHTNLFYPDFSS